MGTGSVTVAFCGCYHHPGIFSERSLPSRFPQKKFIRRIRNVSTASESRVLRNEVLEKLDKELENGDERAALSIVRDSLGKPGGLRCFGAARQVPQRLYTLDELKLSGIEAVSLLSPVDTTINAIERNLQIVAILGAAVAWIHNINHIFTNFQPYTIAQSSTHPNQFTNCLT
ncbi:hypothetical protein V2J09_008110 [Rumex salicifolius]